MFDVVRVRLDVAEDGRILSVLGVEVRGPGGIGVEMRRVGMTEAAWRGGLWLRLDDLSGG